MNKISILWFFAAICFIIAGIIGKDVLNIVLGCAFICIGYSKQKPKSISIRKKSVK